MLNLIFPGYMRIAETKVFKQKTAFWRSSPAVERLALTIRSSGTRDVQQFLSFSFWIRIIQNQQEIGSLKTLATQLRTLERWEYANAKKKRRMTENFRSVLDHFLNF